MTDSTDLSKLESNIALLTPQDQQIQTLVAAARKAFPALADENIPSEAIALALINCRLNNLNPFAKQVHLLPYRNKDGTTTVAAHPGIDTLVARARQATPEWLAAQCGLIIQKKDGTVIREPGEVQKTQGTIMGAYCEVIYRTGHKVVYEVPIQQYARQMARWRENNQSITHMLTKCAMAHACRRNGAGESLYLVEEFDTGSGLESQPPTPPPPKITVNIPPQTSEQTYAPTVFPGPQADKPPEPQEQKPQPTEAAVSAEPVKNQPETTPPTVDYVKIAEELLPELAKRAPWGQDEKGNLGYLVDVQVRGKPTQRAFNVSYIELCAQRGWYSTAKTLIDAAKRVIDQCPPKSEVEGESNDEGFVSDSN